jgi:hypothetical protein
MMVVPWDYICLDKFWHPKFTEFDALTNVSFTQRVICTGSDPFYVHKDIIGTASSEKFNLLNPSSQLILPEDHTYSQFILKLADDPHFAKDLASLLSTLPSLSDFLNILRTQHETFYQGIFDGAYINDPNIVLDKHLMKDFKLNLDALGRGEFHFFPDLSSNLGTMD